MKNTAIFSRSLNQMLTGRSGGGMLNASGTFTNVDGATIGTFNGFPVYAKVINGTLCAFTYDTAGGALQFKPGHWLLNAGLLSDADAAKFSENNPGGGVSTPAGTTTPTQTTTQTGGGILSSILPGNTTTTMGGGATQQQPNVLVIVLIVAVVAGAVWYLTKKK